MWKTFHESDESESLGDPEMDSSDEGSTSRPKTPKILIIGAGIAGIASGESLTRMGFTDFKILESSNRTGGRIWTINVGEFRRISLLQLDIARLEIYYY